MDFFLCVCALPFPTLYDMKLMRNQLSGTFFNRFFRSLSFLHFIILDFIGLPFTGACDVFFVGPVACNIHGKLYILMAFQLWETVSLDKRQVCAFFMRKIAT